jgi:capsular exopolysaccharide synthesis family protein
VDKYDRLPSPEQLAEFDAARAYLEAFKRFAAKREQEQTKREGAGLPVVRLARSHADRASFPPLNGHATGEVFDAEFSEAPRRPLREYLWTLYKYRWLAGTCLGVTFGLTVLITLLSPRLYTASTRLQLSRQSPIQLRLADNVLRLDDGDTSVNAAASYLATQVAALQSRDLAERVLRGWRLAENDAFLRPRPDRRSLLAAGASVANPLRPRGWEMPASSSGGDDGASSAPIDPRLLDRYGDYLLVRDLRGTDLVDVSFTTPSPSLSAFLAAAHTQAYLEANEESRRAADVVAKEFLGRQLREAREQVDRAQAALKSFAGEHPEVAVNQEQNTAAQRVAEVSTLLTKAEGTRVTLQSRYEFLTKPGSDPLAYFLDRPGVEKLRLALLDLRARRASMDRRLGPKHPQMMDLRREEAEVERQLHGEVTQERDAVAARYAAAVQRERELRRKISHLEQAAIALRDLGARYELLKNNWETAHNMHDSLLKQQAATAVNAELAPSNVRVVERSEVPLWPSRPRIGLNLTLGALAGLMFAVGAAFVCEALDSSLKSSEEAEGLLQLPTLANIPNFALAARNGGAAGPDGQGRIGTANGQRDLVVFNEPWSRVAEAFRSMRTAVLFSAPGAPPKMILVTSALTGEGKTVGSVNLAITLAEAGSRVLLLDADVRHPRCHKAFGIANDCGLTQLLAGEAELESVIHALDVPGLSLLAAGPSPHNPAELMSSTRMRQLLQELREQYDFLIIDTPPVLLVTDAEVLAREADGVVLVVKWNDTPRDFARRARDRLLLAGAHLLGLVVNNVGPAWDDVYFYKYPANYGYGDPSQSEQPA